MAKIMFLMIVLCALAGAWGAFWLFVIAWALCLYEKN